MQAFLQGDQSGSSKPSTPKKKLTLADALDPFNRFSAVADRSSYVYADLPFFDEKGNRIAATDLEEKLPVGSFVAVLLRPA